jgi:hypothetical protein
MPDPIGITVASSAPPNATVLLVVAVCFLTVISSRGAGQQ